MNFILDGMVSQWVQNLGVWESTLLLLTVSIGGAIVLEFVVLRALLEYTSRTRTQFDYIVVGELRIPLVVTAALAGIFVLTNVKSITDSVVLGPEQLDYFFGNPALTVIVGTWALAANRIINRFVDEVKDETTRFQFAPIFSNVWTFVVTVGTVATVLRIWNVDISPLLGAAGIAGVAVGFAGKDAVANFFGGIALYFDDTYKLGDFIELETGERGTVVAVGVRSTTLMTRDEVLITVPNSMLNAARVRNQSAPNSRKRIRVPVGVAYGTDIDKLESLVEEIAVEESLVLDSPKPRMRFREFGGSALQYELLCWVHSPTRGPKATHELNRAIYKQLNEADIEIPFPQRDVHVQPSDTNGTGAGRPSAGEQLDAMESN